MDYKSTLNMMQTDFPMRANLPAREPGQVQAWNEMKLYETVQAATAGRPKFILHDGPPYANGHTHLGHVLNKVLKDMIVKWATQAGFDAPYVPGWDTHGLPIELKALKDLGIDRNKTAPLELRAKCAEYAHHWLGVQREEFRRLGVRGDWEHPYMTLKPEYEAKQIEIFSAMALGGHIYRGLKPVYWCAVDETALADAEVEYAEKTSHSIYVAFPVIDGKFKLDGQTRVVIWTTTPWTLPANMGIALNAEVEYGVYATPEAGKLLVAVELAEKVFAECGLTKPEHPVDVFMGADLEGVICKHPLFERNSLVILGDHVTVEDGTGCVHTAPGHGHEDFEVGMKYGLEVLNPVNDRGIFTEKAGPFAGLFYEKANPVIIEALQNAGALLKHSTLRHQYAHCWRCKQPLLYRATVQWFARVEGFMESAISAIKDVAWVPATGEARITAMVEGLKDWCISRQRTWGVPIPIVTCNSCEEPLMDAAFFDNVRDIFREEGSDSWWRREASDFVPAGTKCAKCGGTHFTKEKDIMDVWFDSGSSHLAVLETRPELQWPADVYLEGSDQHRGWFKSSLLTSTVARGRAPYKKVITHGFIVDEQGRKMSKSLGNGVTSEEVLKQYGADIMRLWVSSVDYRGDVHISKNIIAQVAEAYRKIRNTLRYLLGNLYDFDPARNMVTERAEMVEIDRWAMHRLQQVEGRVSRAYREHEYHTVYHTLNQYCTVDLSAVYLDILKDRLYTAKADSTERRSAQTALYRIARALIAMLTPVLAFTTEEAYGYLPKKEGDAVTCQLLPMPEPNPDWLDDELGATYERLLGVREQVQAALEKARAEKKIGSSVEAAVTLYVSADPHGDDGLAPLLRHHLTQLPSLFIVSQVALAEAGQEAPSGSFFGEGPESLAVDVARAAGEKCERCWNYRELGTVDAHPTLCDRCAGVVMSIHAGA